MLILHSTAVEAPSEPYAELAITPDSREMNDEARSEFSGMQMKFKNAHSGLISLYPK